MSERKIATYRADSVGVSFQSDGSGKPTGKVAITLSRLVDDLDDPMQYTTYLATPDEVDAIAASLTRKAQELREWQG